MNKPDLVIGFASTFDNCKKFFIDILSRRYNVIHDDIEPKYLIFGDANFGQDHYRYDPRTVTKIFYTGENVRPNYFTHDYAITFDFENSPRHYRLPLYALEMWAIVTDNKFTDNYDYLQGLHLRYDWEKEFDTKEASITYLQSNPNCIPRTRFVETLLKNFSVYCGGPHLNNMGSVIPRDRLLKFDFLKTKRINVAFENGSHNGYVTEKLIDAFYANTLPIYWGSDMVARDFNPECMLFLRSVDADRSGLGIDIRHLLMNKKAWCDKMSKPRFAMDIPNQYTQFNNFLDWFGGNVYHG